MEDSGDLEDFLLKEPGESEFLDYREMEDILLTPDDWTLLLNSIFK